MAQDNDVKLMEHTTIVSLTLEPTTYEHGSKRKQAKNGYVLYTLKPNGEVYDWQIRPDTDPALLSRLLVGDTYRVQAERVYNTGGYATGWQWTKVAAKHNASQTKQPTSAAQALAVMNPELFSVQQPVSTLRAEVEALLEEVAAQPMSAEMQALLFLFAAELDNNPTAFGGAA